MDMDGLPVKDSPSKWSILLRAITAVLPYRVAAWIPILPQLADSDIALDASQSEAFIEPSHSRAALSATVSKTGWMSVGELAITCRISLVAVCCSSASVRSRLRVPAAL